MIYMFRKKEAKPKPMRKGKVFITTDRGAILPFPTLQKYRIQKRSKQLKQEKKWAETEGLATRPYDPDSFLTFYESNPIFFSIVNQIAIDVAGLGWKLILKEGMKETEKEKKEIEEFFVSLDIPLRRIFKSVLIDWGIIGYFGIETSRNAGGKVDGLYHIPAYSLWAHTDKIRYCQKRGLKKAWFKKFGEEKDYDNDSGKEGKFDLDTRANEIIFYKTHCPKNEHYGIPNILPAVGSVVSLIGIRDYNLSFFTNYGVPDYFVTLDGEWAEGSAKTIQNFLNTEIKGSENAHKTMVLQVPEGGTATFKPLSVEVKEGSFRFYQQILREDILAAYSMPPYRLGIAIIGKLGGSNIKESTVIYNQSVVEPLQEDLEDIINNKIIEQGLGCHSYKFKFNDMDLRDKDAESKRNNEAIEHGKLTPNEARSLEGLGESYTEGDRFYIGANLIEVGEAELEKRDKEMFMNERLKRIVGKKIRGEKMTDEEEKVLKTEIEKRHKKRDALYGRAGEAEEGN